MAGIDNTADDSFAGFIDDYFAECDEHLTTIRRLLADASPSAGLSQRTLDELFRAFHSIKGLSAMVEVRDAELLAHHMEGYLRLLRDRERSLSVAGLDALINGTSRLEQVIAARRSAGGAPPIGDALAAVEALSSIDSSRVRSGVEEAGGPGRIGVNTRRWVAEFTPSKELAGRGVTVDVVRERLAGIGRITDAAPKVGEGGAIRFEFLLEDVHDEAAFHSWIADGVRAAPQLDPTPGSPVGELPAAAFGSMSASHFVRVDLGRLDELMRMIGDVVITRARLGESLSCVERLVPPTEWRTVQENSHALERQLRDLREGVMRVRLVRIGEIFDRMPFAVRDLARESGHRVDVQVRGQETEIDKYLVERMMDPVLHLVRNAVSHGIEPAAERAAAGKPEIGTLALSAASVGDSVAIEIADDGRGVDVEVVRGRARSTGIPVDDGPLEGSALLEVLCAPGFSTRERADRAAGRGVGMSVVLSVVRELGGTLSIDTAPGEGTRFLIELPLTLAITDAIIATLGGQTFAVPQTSVREVIEIDEGSVRAFENNEIVPHRGGFLPLVRLGRIFGMAARPGRNVHLFVVGSGASALGVAVDRILGQREIVVRPMTDPLIKSEGITGATDLGDGRVVLILDLVRAARPRSGAGGSVRSDA
jgi:two-component system chemotaxis sensor kinase CheA